MSVTERRRTSARRDSLLGDQPGAFASARFVRITPMKARRVVDMVRGLPVDDALALLQFAPQAASETVYKVLESAVANAETTEDLDRGTLVVSKATVDEGPTMKRWRPRAQGRATRINKRTSHITLVVQPADEIERPRRRDGRPDGSEDQPERVPPRHLHRPQEPVVRRQALQVLRRRGRRDPQAALQGHGAGRHLQGRDRAHP